MLVHGSQARVERHLRELVERIGARPPGSPANARATAYVREVLERAGLRTTSHPFRTRWWEPGRVELRVDDDDVPVVANPFSRPAEVEGVVRTLPAAEAGGHMGAIVLVGEDLAPEPLIPRAFPFLAPAEHTRLLERLDAVRPAAALTVSAGAPILEDPDLAFPSATVEPAAAPALVGRRVRMRIGGTVHEGSGATVAGHSGPHGPRVVVSAHLDSKVTTPGAFDNAGGVAAVLAWAQAGPPVGVPLEIVLFNGEDHFDNAGEQAWLAATDLTAVAGNVNLDGAGVRGRRTSAVLVGGSPSQREELASFIASRDRWEPADPWYESDHAIFAMQGLPALAVTTAGVHDLLRDLAHTPRDTLDVVDASTLADVAECLDDLVAIVLGG